jgi:hypothetical protein
MKNVLAVTLITLLLNTSLAGASEAPIANGKPRTLVLPEKVVTENEALQKLLVTVTCGYISELRMIPEL